MDEVASVTPATLSSARPTYARPIFRGQMATVFHVNSLSKGLRRTSKSAVPWKLRTGVPSRKVMK
jgi:hypothetical protein